MCSLSNDFNGVQMPTLQPETYAHVILCVQLEVCVDVHMEYHTVRLPGQHSVKS